MKLYSHRDSLGGTGLSFLAAFGGNLTVVLLQVLLDDDKKKNSRASVCWMIPESFWNSGTSTCF